MHSLSDALYMECTPFNIAVVLVSPGSVRSNIAANQLGRVGLPPDSLYADYADAVLQKLHMSQTNSPMPTDAFARRVVGAALRPRPPRYMSLGGMARTSAFLWWFPRGWVLRLFWRLVGEGPRKTARK